MKANVISVLKPTSVAVTIRLKPTVSRVTVLIRTTPTVGACYPGRIQLKKSPGNMLL